MTIALLIDADNLSATHYARILAHAEEKGEVTIRRAYLDGQHLAGWSEVPGLRLMVAPTGKNASDLLMSVDAMELALRENVTQFVLASSDRDFSHLALRLREYGLEVRGIGEAKASRWLREACQGFEVLPEAEPVRSGQDQAGSVAPTSKPAQISAKSAPKRPSASDIERVIREAIIENRGELLLSRVNPTVFKALGVNIGDLPDKKWRIFFKNRTPMFVLEGTGAEICVKLVS